MDNEELLEAEIEPNLPPEIRHNIGFKRFSGQPPVPEISMSIRTFNGETLAERQQLLRETLGAIELEAIESVARQLELEANLFSRNE